MQKALSNPFIMHGIETRVPNANQTILKRPDRVLLVYRVNQKNVYTL